MSSWTLDRLRERIAIRGIARISRSHLHMILQRADLRPHKKRVWLHSPDPQFREKVAGIVELYLHPPSGSPYPASEPRLGRDAAVRCWEVWFRQNSRSLPGQE